MSFDSRARRGWRFTGQLTDDTPGTSDDERATRHDVRGPFEMIETVVGACAAWRAETLAEHPTVAQARIMSGHGATIAAMVHRWAANGRRPCQYRYDDTADVIRWNIPESATGWFVFDPNTSDAGSAPRARSRPPGGTGAKRSRL